MKIFYLYILLLSTLANAHQLRENYLQVDYNTSTKILSINLEIETRLFEDSTVDDNKNGIVSHKELRNHQSKLVQYTQDNFLLFNNSQQLHMNDASVVFHRYQDQTYMQINKSYKNVEINNLHLKYSMFFEREKNHKLLLHLSDSKGDYILDNDTREYTFTFKVMTQLERLQIFIGEGFKHILSGYDHLLFVLMLLVPSIMTYTGRYKVTLVSLVKLVSTFTVAHSMTLFIAGFNLYKPSIMFIESFIALSIMIVSALNLFQKYKHIDYKLVFLFGLLHGFGFANVLVIANITSTSDFLIALFGFNLGVELGQIMVVVGSLILMIALLKFKYYQYVFKSISLLSLLISTYWFLQRINFL